MRIEIGDARPVKPDFGMLREGLRVSQRTTPTAVANDKARSLHDHAESLVRMFAGSKAAECRSAKGSFYPALPPVDEDDAEI